MSDVHYMLNDWNAPKMSFFNTKCGGHEGAGVIVKIGENVKYLKVGQRAGIKPFINVCHVCQDCRTGRDNYCLKAVLTGLHKDGSYKQYVASPESYTTIIPDGVSDYIAGPLMCSASTALTALKASGLKPGDWAVFPGGGGGVGIQAVQLAVAMGLRAVIVDTGSERKALGETYGAEHFVDFKEEKDPVAKIVELTEGGAHGVFVTAYQSYAQSLDYLSTRTGGIVMCIAVPPVGMGHIDLDTTKIIFRNQSIKGTLVSPMCDIDETLDFARRGKLRLEPTVVGLSQFNESVQKLRNGQVAGRIVVDFNKP